MFGNFSEETLALIKGLRKDTQTTGISSATGLNFYYLEPQAKNIYPVFYPLLASTPRTNPMFNGMKVGGTAVNWKSIVGIDAGGYPSISEGNRNSFMNIKERNQSSAFKFLGKDTQVSFQAQQMGLGFDDNIALAQLALLNALLNDEERLILYGNSGPGNLGGDNGYALGVTNTPVLSQVTDSTPNQIGASAQNYVYAVALTPWGVQMASTTGVQLPYIRTNADSSTDTINGGTGTISAVSNSVVTDATHTSIKVVTPPTVGAVGYAYYLSQNASPTTANAFFSKTGLSTDVLTSYVNTNQAANAQSGTVAGAAGNLTADHSYNNLDFDGLLTWTFNFGTATQPSYVKDLAGAGFTANGDGTIKEFEDVIDYMWKNYKISIDKIYVGGSLIDSVSKAVLTASGGANASQRLMFTMDEGGRIVGGTKVVQYRSKFSNSGTAKVVDVVTHPWLPDGVVYFDLINNPYPAAGNAIPSVRRIVSLEDHFSIKWPYRKLQHEMGVYCFETMEHYIPFGTAVLTSVANKVA